MLSWQEIEKYDDTVYETVEAFGGQVKLGSLGNHGFLDYLKMYRENEDDRELRGRQLLAMSIVNPDGSRIPKEDLPRFIESLKHKAPETVAMLVTKASEVNGLTARAGAQRKNESSGTTSGDSGTDSQQSLEPQTSTV